LFDELPISEKLGIVTEWKRYIEGDNFVFYIGQDGELRIGQRAYKTIDGYAYVPQYHVLLGESHKIAFVNNQSVAYDCGIIKRTGSRMIEIQNNLDTCVVSLCAAFDQLHKDYASLVKKVKQIEEKTGITII
jgi:hypothetical protein